MKSLHKILKISAKEAFKKLRERGPYFCTDINESIEINREYWNHLVFQKKRDSRDFQERLLSVVLVDIILEKGTITEQRENMFRIEHNIEGILFALIVKEQNNRYILLSSFVVYEHFYTKKE